MTCRTCSQPTADCRYPISHAHATIDTIKLPAVAMSVLGNYSNGEYPSQLRPLHTAKLNRVKIHDNDFGGN